MSAILLLAAPRVFPEMRWKRPVAQMLRTEISRARVSLNGNLSGMAEDSGSLPGLEMVIQPARSCGRGNSLMESECG